MVTIWDHRDPKVYRAEACEELSARYSEIVDFVDQAITSVTKDDADTFHAIDATGRKWTGSKLMLAIGVQDVLSDIPRYEECWVKGM